MIYRQFKEMEISWLGMGNMRLPKIEGQSEKIDEPKARELIEYAVENGVNYFDTAYRYHAGESETLTGRVLEQYPRDKFYLATKMPGHMMEYKDGKYSFTSMLTGFPARTPQEAFEEQLEKCRVDFFDVYLLHNVAESSWDFYTNEEIGVVPYLLEQKKKGRIKHLGISAHGRAETIDSFLAWAKKNFGDCFELAQIQLNYLDWTLQGAREKYKVITDHGLGVISMESIRGGRLASLGEKPEALLKNARPGATIASWAFRFLQSLPNVTTALSGMTTMDQLKENLALFSKNDPVSEAEKKILEEAVKLLVDLVPCTACRYCCEACPQNLDIPKLISMYNEAKNSEQPARRLLGSVLDRMKESELPQSCAACGACVKLCPQEINIPEILKEFSERLAG